MSHCHTSTLFHRRKSEATAGGAQTRELGQDQKPWGPLLGLTLTTAPPRRIPGIRAESAYSENEVISSLVMELSVCQRRPSSLPLRHKCTLL